MNKDLKIKLIVGALLIACLSFYAGTKVSQSRNAGPTGFMRNSSVNSGQKMRMGGFLSGEVISKDATSITLKTRDGSTKIVLFSASTDILKSTSGKSDDLNIGEQVVVTGSSNADGSLSAQSIQIRPNMPVPPAQTP